MASSPFTSSAMKGIVFSVLVLFMAIPAWAVQNGGAYMTTPPTNAQIPNWTRGWSGNGITGWNYVGQIGGASGVYLGNGWVLTAAHVGSGAFTLGGITYQPVSGSARSIVNTDGTADLTLFEISTSPALSPLTISPNAPIPFSQTQAGSAVAIIGYGGGAGETWGDNTVDFINQLIQPEGYTYVSNDFLTVTGSYTSGTATSTNNSNLVGGDSGGGDFLYNPVTQSWNLAGINEVVGTVTIGTQNLPISGFVLLSTYASQINAIFSPPVAADSPTMPPPALLILACLLLLATFVSRPEKMRRH